ncbi:hypothetical protein T484DRAFT_1766907 [Baffinella frigidus]|nr:hypothetical protein T484DRAFT_1766907 [Cryptophyta sp. CCMP2293]
MAGRALPGEEEGTYTREGCRITSPLVLPFYLSHLTAIKDINTSFIRALRLLRMLKVMAGPPGGGHEVVTRMTHISAIKDINTSFIRALRLLRMLKVESYMKAFTIFDDMILVESYMKAFTIFDDIIAANRDVLTVTGFAASAFTMFDDIIAANRDVLTVTGFAASAPVPT